MYMHACDSHHCTIFLAFQVFELRSVEEMTEEWLIEKLKFFR